MSERLARLAPADLDDQQRSLYNAIAGGPRAAGPQAFDLTDENGALNGPFGLMLHIPHLGHALQELGAAVRYGVSLTDRAREIAILAVAAVTESDFEWYAHERVGRSVGLSSAEIASIRSGTFHLVPGVDATEAAVYSAAVNLADESWAADMFEDATAHLADVQMLELTVLVGYYKTLAQMMSVFGVGAPTVGVAQDS